MPHTYLSRLTGALALALSPVTLCAGELLDLKLDNANDVVTATLTLTAYADIDDFPLAEPDRYVVDLASTVRASDYRSPIVPEGTLVRAVREGAQADGRLRLVFDLHAPVEVTLDSPTMESTGDSYQVKLTLSPKGLSRGQNRRDAEPGGIPQEAAPSSNTAISSNTARSNTTISNTTMQSGQAAISAGTQQRVEDTDRAAEDTEILESPVEPNEEPVREWRVRLPPDWKNAKGG